MKKSMIIAACALGLSACGEKTDDNRAQLTERQKDSLIARSPIPGAKAVNRAMGVADSASARQARIDSVQNSQ